MTGLTLLKGRRILLVEDEMLIAMSLQDVLEDAGCIVTCAGHLEQATLLARDQDLDAAVLDENLHGKRSYPVADALALREIPFIFATGYDDVDLRQLYPGVRVIDKPYRHDDIVAALSALIAAA